MKSKFLLFLMFIIFFASNVRAEQFSISDITFGMSVHELESKLEKYKYKLHRLKDSKTKDYEDMGIRRYFCRYEHGVQKGNRDWDFMFLEGKLSLACVAMGYHKDLPNILKKLNSLYTGRVVIKYNYGQNVWKGKFEEIPSKFSKFDKFNAFGPTGFPKNIHNVCYIFYGENKYYKVKYMHERRVDKPNVIYYYAKDHNKRMKHLKELKRRKMQEQLNKEYHELKL